MAAPVGRIFARFDVSRGIRLRESAFGDAAHQNCRGRGAVVWLASPAGAFVTGQNFVIDGGTLISH